MVYGWAEGKGCWAEAECLFLRTQYQIFTQQLYKAEYYIIVSLFYYDVNLGLCFFVCLLFKPPRVAPVVVARWVVYKSNK